MAPKKKLIIKNKNLGSIIYTVKAGNEIVWEGEDIHRQYKDLKISNKGENLTVSWRLSKEYLSV